MEYYTRALGSVGRRAVWDDGAAQKDWRPGGCIIWLERRPLMRELMLEFLANAAPEFIVQFVPSVDELGSIDATDLATVVLSTRDSLLSDRRLQAQLELVGNRFPDVPVILLSDSEDAREVLEALSCGVRGFIPTSFSPHVVVEAVRLVCAGGTFVPAGAVVSVHELRQAGCSPQQSILCASSDSAAERGLLLLTQRQREVLRLLCQGEPNKKIAHAMDIHESTVKVHVRQIMKKLGVSNRTQAALLVRHLYLGSDSKGVGR